ncbi:MAG: iron-sulfur cluster assembly protein [Bacteroidota bacterium]
MKEKIIRVLQTIYDPEIPVNIYDLGLIYEIRVSDQGDADILMTFTSPNCPMADEVVAEVRKKTMTIDGVETVNIRLTFEPPWDKSMLSDEAMLELGLL